MTTKKYLPILSIIVLVILVACKQSGPENSNKDKTLVVNKTDSANNIQAEAAIVVIKQELTFDTFSSLPSEIDGCSCCFAKDSVAYKKRQYIYMNDYGQTSFLTINGVVTKFRQVEFKEIDSLNVKAKYESDNYELIIEAKDGVQNGDETYIKTGTIKLSDKNGKTITTTFYGECGC